MGKKKQTVLVIEDEMINRRIIKKILEVSYCVVEAENGKVGLEICQENAGSISAILLDLVMPVMNGYEFLEKIEETPYSNIPIIVMTGNSDRETEQNVLKSGAWDFITKPYDATVLNIRLQNAIARSKMAVFDKIKHISEHDSLTGLYNRNKMFEEIRKMTMRMPDAKYVFIRIDIDHFGLYNSSFGESSGDKLLCYFADMIRRSVESFESAVYGRMNADVFCLCKAFDGEYDKLNNSLSRAQDIINDYSKDYLLKISAGAYVISPLENRDLNVGECYLKASLAAKKCKHRFDSVIEYYDDEFRKKIDSDIAITNDMQEALENEEFVVYFQPKYDVSTNCPCGAESLIRWKHPEKGLISPAKFIPVFESNGFISKVDYYVWEHTCRYLRKWIDDGKDPKPVSVNMSRISLYNQNLDKVLLDLVNKYEIPPRLLELEITESAYMTSPEHMHELISRLHDVGFRILMDDFGSEYSSLNSLKDIEVDVLKIDMAFIPKGKNVEKGEIILASIIKMAKWIGMCVVVEGVETRRQRDFLEGAGCDVIQGYYYEKPLPPEKYEEKYVYSHETHTEDDKTKREKSKIEKQGMLLVIDDSETAREIIKSCLETLYDVETCESAEEGLMFLRRHAYMVKMVLVDNIMQGMSGIDFLRFCQNSNELRCIPKVMITVSESTADQLAAFDAGAYDFITKPFVKEIVLARVRHIIDTAYHYSNYDRIKQEYSFEECRDKETGLLTHKSFRDLSGRMLEAFPEDPMALMLIDLDDFNEINQAYGHDEGDEILCTVGREIKSEFRKYDVIGRIGRDEYAVLLCGIPDRKTAVQKCSDVIHEIESLGSREYGIKLSASVGLVYPIKEEAIDIIMAKADQALMEAKNFRKGGYIIYGEGVPQDTDNNSRG